ncbi:MAG: hypothetical protein EOO89_23020 [Pedobacter sp.]|nr:MAG: hypothetical protein EOO89_23020 [Pedobacter sp.]
MEDKEYLVLKYLSRFDTPIQFNELENGLKDHFDKNKKDNLLFVVSNLEFRGLLEDNYRKGIQITQTGRSELNGSAEPASDEFTPRRKKKRSRADEDDKASGFVYRTYWLMFAFSIVSFVLALFSLLFWFFPGLRNAFFK